VDAVVVVVVVVVGVEEDPGTSVGGGTHAPAALIGANVEIHVHAHTGFAHGRLLAFLVAVLMRLKEQHFCCLFWGESTELCEDDAHDGAFAVR
jgi:hypothetical protein